MLQLPPLVDFSVHNSFSSSSFLCPRHFSCSSHPHSPVYTTSHAHLPHSPVFTTSHPHHTPTPVLLLTGTLATDPAHHRLLDGHTVPCGPLIRRSPIGINKLSSCVDYYSYFFVVFHPSSLALFFGSHSSPSFSNPKLLTKLLVSSSQAPCLILASQFSCLILASQFSCLISLLWSVQRKRVSLQHPSCCRLRSRARPVKVYVIYPPTDLAGVARGELTQTTPFVYRTRSISGKE